MDILERLWEILGAIINGILGRVERSITSIFGSANARYLRRLQPKVEAINALEEKYKALSNDELRHQTELFRQRLAKGESLDDLLVEAFAVCRESGRRFLGMRHYDVQLLGGMILHDGSIAEMVTGEGKTLVATLPAYLNALSGKGVHVITVNDYLARRDMEWMGPIFTNLGLTVGAIYSGLEADDRQKSYACDITYGTNNEFGFDYLRDNMKYAARGDDAHFPKHVQQAQGRLNYAIIDEVDNILIDEARTPLIISGPAEDDVTKYRKADAVARALKKDIHFEVKEKEHTVTLTEEGVRAAEGLAGVESFYTAGNMQWPHLIDNSLKAHYLYKRDVNYVVNEGKVVIVDEFTGRLMEGRQWSDGLHQAVEAKEGVEIKQENQTLATITLQNFFKLYGKLAGMTGTALTEASEFWKIYKLNVVGVPTNRPMKRIENPDVIYRTEREKYHAIADEIERINKHTTVETKAGWFSGKVLKDDATGVEVELADNRERKFFPRAEIKSVQKPGRPILVGTVSIEKSEALSNLLNGRGIKHEVLNAKQHKREAEIVAQAGRKCAVTIATNMAGRGTDIILGGNPETMAWAQLQSKYASRLDIPHDEWETTVKEIATRERMKEEGAEVRELGGLCIVGTERHEARRIDLQLRGRCGRQGDPGSSRFYLSLEDDLMRIFAGEWVKNMLTRLGMQEGEAIESKMVSRRIEGAQKKREEYNFEIRKNLLEYDEVMDEQRKRVYGYRQRILDGDNCRNLILEMIQKQLDVRLKVFLDPKYGLESFAAAAGERLGAELEARDFRGCNLEEAEVIARTTAERNAETIVFDAIEENLPESEDESEWNWAALAKWSNTRWGTNYRDSNLKKIGRDQLDEELIARAHEAIAKVDLKDTAKFLEPDFGIQSACGFMQAKFGVAINPAEVKNLEPAKFIALMQQKAEEAYVQREAEYPVLAGGYRYSRPDAGGGRIIDTASLANWARARFSVELPAETLASYNLQSLHQTLVAASAKVNEQANTLAAEAAQKVDTLFAGDPSPAATLGSASGMNGKLDTLTDWIKTHTGTELKSTDLAALDRDEAQRTVSQAIEDKYRPEMRRMERSLILQILDSAWKDHLRSMDHLRGSVGLRGYAQVDPKVEYKREGMRMFEAMWDGVGSYVTDLIFKMEQLDENFIGSTWVETKAIHAEAPTSDIQQQQQAAIDASNVDTKLEPIRNRGEKVGRNDPCPCGSGKKYKQCHMRQVGF